MTAAGRLVVVWRVAEACDLDCAYCEYRRSAKRPRRSAAPETVLIFGKLLADYQRATGRPVLLSWLGGEPLHWPPVWEVSSTLHREHGLALSLTTNGTRLSAPALRQRLIDDFAEVTLSVDGDAATHDSVRGAPGLHAHLRSVIADLRARKLAAGRGPVLRVNTVLMHSNIMALESFGADLAAWGVEELTFNPLGGAPGDPFYEAERLRPADVAWLTLHLPALRARLAQRGLVVRGSRRYVHRLDFSARSWQWPVEDCAPGDRYWFVDEHARLAPCSFASAEYGLPLSALRTVADLESIPRRLAAQRRLLLAAACHDCHSPQVFGKFALEAA